MASNNPYTFDASSLYHDIALDPTQTQIRVLTIHRAITAGDGKLVECSLKVVDLEDNTLKFNALSYAWGDPNDTTAITVNGLKVVITRSLAGALRNLRDYMPSANGIYTELLSDDKQPFTIWADAICINQEDAIERSQQVQIMDQIYATASNVIVWLGEGNQHTDFALDHMNQGPQGMGFSDHWEDDRSFPPEKFIKVEVILKQILCKRPWWRRLWVRQEFVLAKNDPCFMCGSRMVKSANFIMSFILVPREWDYPRLSSIWSKVREEVMGAGSVGDNTLTPSALTSAGIHPMSLDRVREKFIKNHVQLSEFGTLFVHPISLPYAIKYVLSNSEATDPRDYIYGILGLLDHSIRNKITFDYTIEPMELFQQISYILWSSSDFWTAEYTMPRLLPLLEFRNQPELIEGEEEQAATNSYYKYPSWVPDFSAQPIRGWKDYYSLLADSPLSFPSHLARKPPATANSPIILLQGTTLDTIKTSTATPQDFTGPDELVPLLLEIESEMNKAIAQPIPPSHRLRPLESLKHAEEVVHTLTRNTWEDYEPLFPGIDDDQVWDLLVRGKPPSPSPFRSSSHPVPSNSRYSNSQYPNTTNSQDYLPPPDNKTSSIPPGYDLASPANPLPPRERILSRISTALRGKFLSRRVFITEAGFVGIGVRQIRDGDVVTFPFGCPCPLVLRAYAGSAGYGHGRGDGDDGVYYRMVGCAYVSGLMEAEKLDRFVEGGVLGVEEIRIC